MGWTAPRAGGGGEDDRLPQRPPAEHFLVETFGEVGGDVIGDLAFCSHEAPVVIFKKPFLK